MEKYIETTMENLERNNIKPFYVEKREEVVPLIKTLLKKGESISCGGSVTLHECEVDTKILKSGDYDFMTGRVFRARSFARHTARHLCATRFSPRQTRLPRGASFIMSTAIQTVLLASFTVRVR